MALAIGITGLAQSGKSSLFQALTAASQGDVGGKRLPMARAPVPDERLDRLSAVFHPKKTTPATVDFLDMPGGSGTGLGDQALGEIRTATALVEVVRCFPHGYLGEPTPQKDMEDFELEIMLADLKIVEGRLERAKKLTPPEKAVLERLQPPLAAGDFTALPEFDAEELKLLSGMGLLSLKPRIYCANLAEDLMGKNSEHEQTVRAMASRRGTRAIATSALLESEVAQLEAEERQVFLHDLGIQETGLSQLVRASYERLGLMTFFTVGEDECRAWTVRQHARAPEAAGAIHSDLERGFIRAEVIGYDTFLSCGSMAAAKDQGKLRVEGKDYEVHEGEIVHIRFNV